ncbi:MAG: glycosyltransferase family 4 protein [Bacteroidia bacterium]|nr:glycosyltransferase family 4 protein [Bacteroidia bacterium]
MKVAFIARPNLYSDPGGDTIQIVNTAKFLAKLGVEVDIFLSTQTINYNNYDLVHFFNVITCEDLLGHALKCKVPYLLSTIYVNYREYDKYHRKDLIGLMSKFLASHQIEYLKTLAKFLFKGEKVSTLYYFIKGHKSSIKYLLKNAACILPNSNSEYKRVVKDFGVICPKQIVTYAIDKSIFSAPDLLDTKKEDLVLCVGRVEGRKNQLNLIKAANSKKTALKLIGNLSVNQKSYVNACKQEAGSTIEFVPFITQTELTNYYKRAKVHVLPSWFETAGLATMEAAAMGCNIVIADKGDVREYFGDLAYYCEPENPDSIAIAIELALRNPVNSALQEKVFNEYTWEKAAEQTLAAYKKVLKND